MKKILLISLLFFGVVSLKAQSAVPTQAQITTFLKSKTYVVLDQSMFGSTYNAKIKQAMQKHWKITEFKFITRAQYQQLRTNPRASFLAKTEVIFKKDKHRIKYQFLNLMLGTYSGNVTKMPDLANFPLAYADGQEENYAYKLGTILIFLQNHIKLLQNHPELSEKNIIRYYNKQGKQIHNKTLYVLKNELSIQVNTLSKIKKIYHFPIKIVSRQEVEDAINNKDASVVFFHVVRPEAQSTRKERCYKIILGAADARLYYWSMDKINAKKPAGILVQDFKKLQK